MMLNIQLDRLDLPDETISQADIVTIGGESQGGMLTLTATETEIPISIAIPGLMYVRNYSDTIGQYVEIGYLTGTTSHCIYDGEIGLIPLDPTKESLFVRASSGTLKFEYEIIERAAV